MKIAFLWYYLTGFWNSCLKELAGREGVELFVCHMAATKGDAPFDDGQFAWMTNRMTWRSSSDLQQLEARLEDFMPDIIVFAGWHQPRYRAAAKRFVNRCWRVMSMDNCWLGTLKQRLGVVISRAYVQPLADAIWVPGERQAVFARRLGFGQRAILRGLLSCDQPAIDAAHKSRLNTGGRLPRSFLFVGRFAPEKGVNTLVKAYVAYRRSIKDPWPLICCGTGPLRSRFEGQEGIILKGFVQPDQIPAVLASAGCLVLPSTFEPWAVVVHEAACAGLPILVSEKVGAAVHLVQPNYNGFIFGDGDGEGLAACMTQISAMSDERREEMSRASSQLSKQFSPRLWADVLLESFAGRSKDPSLSAITAQEVSSQRHYFPADEAVPAGKGT